MKSFDDAAVNERGYMKATRSTAMGITGTTFTSLRLPIRSVAITTKPWARLVNCWP